MVRAIVERPDDTAVSRGGSVAEHADRCGDGGVLDVEDGRSPSPLVDRFPFGDAIPAYRPTLLARFGDDPNGGGSAEVREPGKPNGVRFAVELGPRHGTGRENR